MKNRIYLKVGMIILVAILLLIPLGMIAGVVYERSAYRNDVIRDIERTWTGSQTLAGPVLAVPYLVDVTESFTNKKTGLKDTRTRSLEKHLYLVPDSLHIDSRVDTESRSRGIYTVPVFTSQQIIRGEFRVSDLDALAETTEGFVRWGNPTLNLLVSDIRGIGANPVLTWNGVSHSFAAGSTVPHFPAGIHADVELTKGATRFPLEISLPLRGSQGLSYVPLARELQTAIQAGWPHPKFDGQFLPEKRDISDSGFTATWRMSAFATNAQAKLNECVLNDECHAVRNLAFGVKFFEPVDIYAKVTRSVKYGALFIALTFVAFFLTEVLSKSRLHPLQYALVGLSLAVFYLLLISLSEHIPFAAAYLIATLACTGLIGVYLGTALGKKSLARAITAGITLLYAMLFGILGSEDFALLMGSLLLFAMLATVMMLTRGIDWYGLGSTDDPLT